MTCSTEQKTGSTPTSQTKLFLQTSAEASKCAKVSEKSFRNNGEIWWQALITNPVSCLLINHLCINMQQCGNFAYILSVQFTTWYFSTMPDNDMLIDIIVLA